MTRDQIHKARAMLAQGVPERFVAGSLDVSAKTLRHCLQLAEEFETFVRHVHEGHYRCEQARAQDAERISELERRCESAGQSILRGARQALDHAKEANRTPAHGFSEEEERAYQEAVAAGKVERIENGEWPDRNLQPSFWGKRKR